MAQEEKGERCAVESGNEEKKRMSLNKMMKKDTQRRRNVFLFSPFTLANEALSKVVGLPTLREKIVLGNPH